MSATRYVRYIVVAVVCLAILFFVTSSPNTTEQLDKVGSRLSHWRDYYGSAINGGAPVEPVAEHDLAKAATSTSLPKVPAGPGRMNATFVTLARNSDLWEIVESIRQVEDRFNHQFGYDWVFLNDQEFDDDFKKVTSNLISGTARYGLIPEEHWSYPKHIDQKKAAAVREDMRERKIIYGDSESYRHMCRFESGFFFRQPLMLEYEWYWRVEPSVKLFCDIKYDPFRFMAENGKTYSFVLSLFEYFETIPTLWDSVKTYMTEFPDYIAPDNSMDFLSDDGGKTYNKCHFWSNFEIGNLNWLRSPAYLDFFDRLDKDGGFFYERWGDAPVHSIAAGLLLPKEEIHFFNDIAYYHVPFTHCPVEEKIRVENKCHCNPSENFDWNSYSCTNKFYDLHKMKKPSGVPLTKQEKTIRIVLGALAGIIFLGSAFACWVRSSTSRRV